MFMPDFCGVAFSKCVEPNKVFFCGFSLGIRPVALSVLLLAKVDIKMRGFSLFPDLFLRAALVTLSFDPVRILYPIYFCGDRSQSGAIVE